MNQDLEVLKHDDIREVTLSSRVDEPGSWPAVINRP